MNPQILHMIKDLENNTNIDCALLYFFHMNTYNRINFEHPQVQNDEILQTHMIPDTKIFLCQTVC